MPEQATPSRWPALLSPESLAEYLGLSVRSVEKLRAMGELPAPIRMPGDLRSVRWRRCDIDEFLTGRPLET